MSDIDPLGQFKGINFPGPMPRSQPVQPAMALPPAQVAPQPQPQPDSMFQGTGIIDFFKSLFHRQNDLDDIMKQNGLRGEAVPATGGVRG